MAMDEADGAAATTGGREQDTSGEGAGAVHRIDIGGSPRGPVVAGNHNLVVDAQHGSTVTLLVERERPRPERRPRVELLPRVQQEPVGRGPVVTALADAIGAGGLVQLYGPPGIGTSLVLRHAVRRLAPGPDGVLYLNAAHREVGDLAQEIFEACYDSPGYAPSDTELRRLMAGVRVTVYIDNADLGREQLLALADIAQDAVFVFASHSRSLLGDDGTALEMRGLDVAAAIELFARELRRPLDEGETAAATSLWEAAEGRPLQLLRAASLARPGSAGEARLPRPGEVADLVPLLLGRLDAEATSVVHLLATLGGVELDPVHIGAITEVADAAGTCDRLVRLGLLLAEEHGYRCAPDTAPALHQRLPEPFSVDQICRYFARWATRPTTMPVQVAEHGPALERAAALAELAGRPDLAVRVARSASPALARSLRFGAWARLLGRGWTAARSAGDRRAEAYFTHEEGIRNLLTGRRVMAGVLLAEALVLWRQLGDGQGVNAALHAHQYAPPMTPTPPAPPAPAAPPVHDGGATAAHGAGSAHSAAAPPVHDGGATAAHSAGSAHSAAAPPIHDGGATAAHTAAGHATTAAHTTTTPSAAAHMTSLSHAPAGHGAVSLVPHAAGHAAAGSIGTAGAGAAAATGAGAAGATGTAVAVGTTVLTAKAVVTLVLAVIAVVLAAAIGSGSFDPEDTSAGGTDLAGVWNTEGGAVRIAASGSGTYTAPDGCGGSVEFTGSAGTYSAPWPMYDKDKGPCSRLGTGLITVSVSPDGSTARVSETAPSDLNLTCFNCGLFTWTRLSSK
ncbi:ATP-binding protein [Streptomyces sp. NPDC097981]|uniref:ATP-binding protein n=1 Tax=Streptomyces sp. NPDC097981 TaxID=3155428 RepID=UPI00331A2FAC